MDQSIRGDRALETPMDRGSPTSDRATTNSPHFDSPVRSPFKELQIPVPGLGYLSVNSNDERIQDNDPGQNLISPEEICENYTLDQGQNHISPEEICENYTLDQLFKDDCFIPSPALKSASKLSFFGPDLASAVQKIGIKYNSLLEKHQVKKSEAEILLQKCETLGIKCLQECEPKYEKLKGLLAVEIAERKRLYNELIELRGNIRVFCRCRPLSTDEISKGSNSVIEFDSSKDTELQITCADSSRKLFKFDHIFNPKDEQETVFSETSPVVKSVMDGFNVCIFAYGQTGTGKTFTMEGTPECRGVNYRALEELFRITNQRIAFMRYEFSFSMLEVYNEKIRDLLADTSDICGRKLDIKQTAEGTQEIPGLAEVQFCSIDEVWELLKSGGRHRSVGSTNANELSSRSHSLVRVTVKGENLLNGERRKSFLWLVDLAGSERVGKIEAEGERLKESQFINKSLSSLGDVISALASKNSHIPYRNSKLTHLLQSSLGGDCKTLMFAQISPSLTDLGETLCTLNFASRVRGVEHGPAKKQSDPIDSFKLKQMSEKLRIEEKEVSKLNQSLQLMHMRCASRENSYRTLQEKIREFEQTCKKYQQKVKDLENQLQLAAPKETFRSLRPPLAPAKERPPLAGLTNRLPHFPPRHTTAKTNHQNKENFSHHTIKDAPGFPRKPLGRARRISLSPVICNISQTRRRATLATEIETLPQFQQKQQHFSHVAGKLSQARRSMATAACPPLQETPKVQGELTNRFNFSSPSQPAMWRTTRLSGLPSPSQGSQILSGGRRSSAQSQNKLCYSIQKNVTVVGSTRHLETRFNEEALRAKEIVGRYGFAQRVLNRNRRKTLV
ncbi:Kinesin-4 [Platanthera guangdongensis]|uniref:Kinesin-4 n=1 Tax=Platanthera guangdongensis TaxID=2320717 RepID=A0ABR2M837_9ASPA